jgi:hypothetical protein
MGSVLTEKEQRLNRLLDSLTPTQKQVYGARINKLKREVELEKLARSLPRTTAAKKQVNTERKQLLGDKLIDAAKVVDIKKQFQEGNIGDMIKHHHAGIYNVVTKSVKANTKEVSGATSEKATLIRAATIYAREGEAQAKGYLSQMGIENYEIMPESSSEALVLRNTNTGKTKVAFRGTLIPKELKEIPTTVGDIGTDLAIMSGYEDQTPQYKRADALVKDVKAKYDVDELIGYSLGGAKAISLGDKYNIDSNTFNPLIGRNHVTSQETSAKHTVHRTTEDMPSLGVALLDRENVDVKSYYPYKSNMFNVKRTHDLENFMKHRGKVRSRASNVDSLTESAFRGGIRAGEIETMNSMANFIDDREAQRPRLPRFGQKMSDAEKAKFESFRERFESFKEPTFTEFVHKFNKGGNGVDTNAEGELLPSVRMTDKSTWGKLWEAAGGEYTPEEIEIFRNSNIPESEPAISRDMTQRIANADKAGRQEILNKHLEDLNSIHDQLAEATDASEIMPLRNEGQTLGFGASTGISLLSGLAADNIVGLGESVTGKKIDDSKDVRTGVVGGLGGYLTTRGVASLAGEAVGGEELAVGTAVGTASAIAGKEASKFVADKGGGEFAQREAGGVASGATAGLGSALGAGALLGAEAGVPLDAETLGMASVVGAGIGAGFSAIGYGLSKLGINI